MSVNCSSGPPISGRPIESDVVYSGAYQGGAGDEQLLIAESNTLDIAPPSCAGKAATYSPFIESEELNERHIYQAET